MPAANPDAPQRRRLKVCHVAATTEGAVWMVEQLAGLHAKYGWDVCAVVSGPPGTLSARLEAAGIRWVAMDFSFAGSRDLLKLPAKIRTLSRFFRAERFDVVQTHLFNSMVIGRFASWLADVPVRCAMIAGPFHLEAYTPRWIDRSTCWMETSIIASCEHTRALYRSMGVSPRRLELVYYGADPGRFDPAACTPAPIREELGWPADTQVITMVAYFYPPFIRSRWIPRHLWGETTKGHEYLIRAMPLVLAELPEAKCLLVGSGWESAGAQHMETMRRLVHDLGLEGSITFAGFRSDVNEILRASDVAVQPSLTENLGGTIESLLMACPTVASRIGGMPDSVRDGVTGVLVAPRDPASLARGIVGLLRDRDRAQGLAQAGRSLMLERFTLDRTVDDLAAIYSSRVVGQRGYSRVRAYLGLLLVAPLAAMLALRFYLIDALWLPRWDAGWRPWRIGSWKPLAASFRSRARGFLWRLLARAFQSAASLRTHLRSLALRLWCWGWRVGAALKGHLKSLAKRVWRWAGRVGSRVKRLGSRHAA